MQKKAQPVIVYTSRMHYTQKYRSKTFHILYILFRNVLRKITSLTVFNTWRAGYKNYKLF